MLRTITALILALVLLAGFTVQSTLFRSANPGGAPLALASVETGETFYAALNDALAGKQAALLAGLLSPLFQDHDTDSGVVRSAGAFLAEIQAMSGASSHARFEVLSVDASGNTLIAQVQRVESGTLEIAGLAAEHAEAAPHAEVLRVERGLVVDRWAPGMRWLDVTGPEQVTLDISSSLGVVTSLTRLELDGSSEQAWRVAGAGIVLVETGSAKLLMSDGQTIAAPVVLEKGGSAAIPSGMQVRVRSADGAHVSVLRYLVSHVGESDQSHAPSRSGTNSSGGTKTELWSGIAYWTESSLVYRPTRIVLPANDTVLLTLPAGVELLAGASMDGVEVASSGSPVAVRGENGWPLIAEGVVALDADHGVWIEGGCDVTLRNTSSTPVTLMLISVAVDPGMD